MSAPHTSEMESLAHKLWGEPGAHLSTRDELRFCHHGSKPFKLGDGIWFDHKAGEGGGYPELYAKVYGKPPSDPSIVAEYYYRNVGGKLLLVCASDRPRSAIISTRSRKLSLNRRYQRTHRMTTSRSKCRPANSSLPGSPACRLPTSPG